MKAICEWQGAYSVNGDGRFAHEHKIRTEGWAS